MFFVEWLSRFLRVFIVCFFSFYTIALSMAAGVAFICWDMSIIAEYPFAIMARISAVVALMVAILPHDD